MQGGLQEHSLGEYYPCAIVGYQAYSASPVSYFIEDLTKGTVLCTADGDPVEFTFGEAADWMQHRTKTTPFVMLRGRPQYDNEHKYWGLLHPANPVAVVRLRNMLHRGT